MHVHAAPVSPSAGTTKTALRFSLAAALAYVVITLAAALRALYAVVGPHLMQASLKIQF